jgi:hypothetical protein
MVHCVTNVGVLQVEREGFRAEFVSISHARSATSADTAFLSRSM